RMDLKPLQHEGFARAGRPVGDEHEVAVHTGDLVKKSEWQPDPLGPGENVNVAAAPDERLGHLRRGSDTDPSDDSREGCGLLREVRVIHDIATQNARELDVVLAGAFPRRGLALELRTAGLSRIAGDEDAA